MKTSLTLSLASIALSTALWSSVVHSQPTTKPQETEVEALRRKVAQQQERIKYLQEITDGIGADGNALRAPFGRFLLVKDGARCLAVQITEHMNLSQGEKPKSKYRWWLQPDGSLDFTRANVTHGQGELCEYRNGKDTGEDFIRAGHFKLMWSLGDWIYFSEAPRSVKLDNTQQDNESQNNVHMAITELVRPEDIQTQSKTINWRSAPKPRPVLNAPAKAHN